MEGIMSYKIVVDSCCELPEKYKKDPHFEIVPLGLEAVSYTHLDVYKRQPWSYPSLKKAPCRYTGSAEENSLIIAAHNYKRHRCV